MLRQCVVLVGGFGTRLGPLTQTIPKPLLNVGGRPFLAWIAHEIARHGLEELVLLSGYRAEQVQNAAGELQALGLGVKVVVEPEPAGTAGALLYARELLKEEFLLLNGDSFFDINLLDIATGADANTLARIALRRVEDAGRYGAVELKGEFVTAFREKTAASPPGLINGGVYWMLREVLDRIGQVPASLEREVFPALINERMLKARVYDRPFIDIGIPSDFQRAQTMLPAIARRGAVFFDRDGVLNRDVGYAHRPEQIEWLPGAFEAVKKVNDAGLYAFVVTNQAGVARGYYLEEQVLALHDWMAQCLASAGAHIDDWAYSPYHPTAGQGKYLKDTECRKPKPGMLIDLMNRWPIDPGASFLIGDQPSDLAAAAAAGIRGVQFTTDRLDQVVEAALASG